MEKILMEKRLETLLKVGTLTCKNRKSFDKLKEYCELNGYEVRGVPSVVYGGIIAYLVQH